MLSLTDVPRGFWSPMISLLRLQALCEYPGKLTASQEALNNSF